MGKAKKKAKKKAEEKKKKAIGRLSDADLRREGRIRDSSRFMKWPKAR